MPPAHKWKLESLPNAKETDTESLEITEVPPREGFDFSEALASVYPLLELVFDYLSFSDLRSAAKVRRSWEEAAEKVLRQRSSLSWMCMGKQQRHIISWMNENESRTGTGLFTFYGPHYEYNNKTTALIFFNYYMISLSDKVTFKDRANVNMKLKDLIAQKIVPEGVKYCVLGCPGLTTLAPFAPDRIKPRLPLFNVCFLPNIPNVDISLFYYNFSKEYAFPPDQKLRCLLIFCKSDLKDVIFTVLRQLVAESQSASTAVAGGIIRNSLVFPLNSENPSNHSAKRIETLCITFRERTNAEISQFDAFSVVITGAELKRDDFKNQLIKFKERTVMRTNSVALRICCAAKYTKRAETDIFCEVFPNTLLLGFDVDGEIGWDSPTIISDEAPPKKKSKCSYPQVQHQWSTIFVLLTWGRVISHA